MTKVTNRPHITSVDVVKRYDTLYIQIPTEVAKYLDVKEGDSVNWVPTNGFIQGDFMQVHKIRPFKKPVPYKSTKGNSG